MIRSAIVIAATLILATPAAAQLQRLSEGAMAESTSMDWSRVPEYRMVPGDEITFNFGPQTEFSTLTGDLLRRQKIRPDGRLSVFPIGDVVAAGRTVRELESELVRLLGAELKRPRVTIEVTEVAGNQVHVLGRVVSPGSYTAGAFLTVSQAVAAAGGFQDDASTNSVLVFHRDGARTVTVKRVRLGEALKRGRLEADLPLGRFDIVYIPRSTIGNINVFVKQFFTDNIGALQFAFIGWELFNLDKVFVVGSP